MTEKKKCSGTPNTGDWVGNAAGYVSAVVKQDPIPVKYDTPAEIDAMAEIDVRTPQLVENDNYGSGAEAGCSQQAMWFGAASSVSSFNVFVVLFISGLYLM